MKAPESGRSRSLRRYHARRREALRVVPSDLTRFLRGDLAPALAPHVAAAQAGAAALFDALGGVDAVSPQRALIAGDVIRLDVLIRGEVSRYLRLQDPDAASRIGTLATARARLLAQLGLDRFERDVPSLRAYIEQNAKDRAGAPIEVHRDADAGADRDAAAGASGEVEATP